MSEVELGRAGLSLQADAKQADAANATNADGMKQTTASSADVQFLGEGASRKLRFTSAKALHQAVKDGYVELGGQQYFLSDDMMRTLTAKDKAKQHLRQAIAPANMKPPPPEDDKISQKNDDDREWEQSPSSIPDAVDTPVPSYSVDVDLPETGVDIEA